MQLPIPFDVESINSLSSLNSQIREQATCLLMLVLSVNGAEAGENGKSRSPCP